MNVSEQIKLEKSLSERDANKYYGRQDKLRDKGLGDQVDSHSYVIKDAVLEVAATLEKFATHKTKGIGGKHNAFLRTLAARVDSKGNISYDYPAVAFIGLQAIFQGLSKKKDNTWHKLAHIIAARLEADHKARIFEAHEPLYFKRVIKSFSEQQVQQYQHKHRVLMMKFNEFEIKWKPWDANEKIQAANKVIIAILQTLPEVLFRDSYKRAGKTVMIIDTTADADDWFAEFERETGFLRPSHPPMIVPPMEWYRSPETGEFTGGYYTHTLAKSLPFVKARSNEHKEHLKQHTMEQHRTAINKIQNTGWKINNEVLNIQTQMFRNELGNGLPHYKPKELPNFPEHIASIPEESWTDRQKEEVLLWKGVSKRIHTQNRLQKGKVLSYKSIADTAREYTNYEAFYFVYNSDFRGRIYCATAGLSPQGEDLAKGLLTFATSYETTRTGLYWLAVHGANTYGKDKMSYDARVAWIYDTEDQLRAVAKDPISTREYWGSADKPWQFLAFVLEWARTDFGSDSTGETSLPIGLDGSCNGIQHYSAILLDRVGGSGVNLVDSDIPSDIYQDVANALSRRLNESSTNSARIWTRAGITRKLTKRPVMTLPYGSTRQSCKEYVYEWMLENRDTFPKDDKELFNLALYLTALLWDCIGEVVVAATEGMAWLQTVASAALKQGRNPLAWISPVDFPVYQDYRMTTTTRISTMIAGSIIPRVKINSQEYTEAVNIRKQRTGVPPNFIHSVDAAHLVMTVNNTDMTHYAMIHDDFGTHAAFTEDLWVAVRESFVELHKGNNLLEQWQEQQGQALDLPELGTLDIDEVLKSTYFFG